MKYPILYKFIKFISKVITNPKYFFLRTLTCLVSYNKINSYVKDAFEFNKNSYIFMRLENIINSRKIKNQFDGKSFAIIGNAESLLEAQFGKEIDEHDIVIRINRAKVIDELSQGSKIDIWATSFSYDLPPEFNAKYTLWMFPFNYGDINYPKADKLKGELILHKYKDWENLKKKLGSVPSTGIMVLDFILQNADYKKIDMYGFDFFKTKNLYEKRDISGTHHRFDIEKEYIFKLLENNDNINLRRKND